MHTRSAWSAVAALVLSTAAVACVAPEEPAEEQGETSSHLDKGVTATPAKMSVVCDTDAGSCPINPQPLHTACHCGDTVGFTFKTMGSKPASSSSSSSSSSSGAPAKPRFGFHCDTGAGAAGTCPILPTKLGAACACDDGTQGTTVL